MFWHNVRTKSRTANRNQVNESANGSVSAKANLASGANSAKICIGHKYYRQCIKRSNSNSIQCIRSFLKKKKRNFLIPKSAAKKEGYGPLMSKVPRFVSREQRFHDRMFHPSDHAKTIKKSWKPFGKSMREKKVSSFVPG